MFTNDLSAKIDLLDLKETPGWQKFISQQAKSGLCGEWGGGMGLVDHLLTIPGRGYLAIQLYGMCTSFWGSF